MKAQIRKAVVAGVVAGASLLLAATAPAEAEVASYYCEGFEGNYTSSGDVYECYDYTAASNTYPPGTYLRVWANGTYVDVVVTDTGGFGYYGRDIDLSLAAAEVLGIAPYIGVDYVDIEWLGRDPYWYSGKQY